MLLSHGRFEVLGPRRCVNKTRKMPGQHSTALTAVNLRCSDYAPEILRPSGVGDFSWREKGTTLWRRGGKAVYQKIVNGTEALSAKPGCPTQPMYHVLAARAKRCLRSPFYCFMEFFFPGAVSRCARSDSSGGSTYNTGNCAEGLLALRHNAAILDASSTEI